MRDPPWTQPQLPLADEKRLRAQLERIGAKGVKYVRGCQLWIEMWSSGPGRETARKKYRYGPPMFRIIEIKPPLAGEPPARTPTTISTNASPLLPSRRTSKAIGGSSWTTGSNAPSESRGVAEDAERASNRRGTRLCVL
ncbi:MAG: hypothetical protein WDN03_17625 [Rhizomicrobium sp.]